MVVDDHLVRYCLPWGEPPEGVEVLWKASAQRFSYVIDSEMEYYGTTAPQLELKWHPVKHWTKCGARLRDGKYVNLDKKISNREWASRTKREAIISLKAKRTRQIQILNRQLSDARQELALMCGIKDV